MLILITYDVSTVDRTGRNRLRKVAKACCDYGLRVQNSVFECELDGAQWTKLKERLLRIIVPDEDSIRFYYLGADGRKKVEHHGIKETPDLGEDLLLL